MTPLYNLSIPLQPTTIILQGRPLCTFERPFSWQWDGEDGWFTAGNWAWTCPKCLQTWAIAHSEEGREFWLLARKCPSCGGDGTLDPPESDPGLWAYAPRELVLRELKLLLDKE